ncbi:family 78 glycoside hydrolase catalytic domain [Streptomyces griseorubiginosus]|uniref:family 78 glycoside hydrolase catalytic domain n=1 Tax=Streptomyces griseorubiginosus TaxID=67304 RepID=UPI0036E013E0
MADGRWLVDLGREIAGGLALEVTGSAGDTVEVRLGEELNPDGSQSTRSPRSWLLPGSRGRPGAGRAGHGPDRDSAADRPGGLRHDKGRPHRRLTRPPP